MEFDDCREPIEFFLLGLDEKYPEDVGMALTSMWTNVDIIDNEILYNVERKKFGKHKADFIDLDGRPRLRLSTISKITGISQNMLEEREVRDFGNDKFRDAADFIRLTREKYAEDIGEMRKVYLQAWHDFHKEAPEKLKIEIDKKFREMFGKELVGMKPIGTDENGESLYSIEEVAKAFGISREDALRHAKEMQTIAPDEIFSMPEPDTKTVH